MSMTLSDLNDYDVLAEYISLANDRANSLHKSLLQSSTSQSMGQTQLTLMSLQELSLSLEELRIAEEEMRLQNEALIESRLELEAEKRRYQELFDFAPDGYLVTDLMGMIQEGNRMAANLLNIDQHRLVGKLLVTFIPQTQRTSFRSALNQMPQLGRLQNWEIPINRWRAGEFQGSLSVQTEYDDRGQAIALRWMIRDITDRKRSETELHTIQAQNAELTEAQRFKTKYIAQVTHDLRSPLTSIIGFAELLKRRFENSDANTLELTQAILRGGEQLLTLIDTLLELSRAQSQRLVLHPDSFDLKALIDETLANLQSLAGQKALHLSSHCPVEELPMVSDRARIQQILVNLISNAIKFTETGTVLVEITPLERSRVLISVHDTGMGIHPDDLPHIFEEFWQAKRNRPSRRGDRLNRGSGLGLCITKTLVDLLQGTIMVESQLNQGSTFSIDLPLELPIKAAG